MQPGPIDPDTPLETLLEWIKRDCLIIHGIAFGIGNDRAASKLHDIADNIERISKHIEDGIEEEL